MAKDGGGGEDAQLFGGVALAGVVIAFAWQPLLRFTDPDWLMSGGVFLGVGLAALYYFDDPVTERMKVRFVIVGVMLICIGVITLFWAQRMARQSAALNDTRCLAIQRDMLSARPKRDDGPDLFQALDCRPQGGGSVYARPPSLTERAR